MGFGDKTMNVAVVGLWHLGCVTAACLAELGHKVIAYDEKIEVIKSLREGISPVFEPGLNELILKGSECKNLSFYSDPTYLNIADIIWVTYDTPVNDEDTADTAFVVNNIINLIPYLKNNAILLISSQLPVGSIKQLSMIVQEQWKDKGIRFACMPENLRLGKAIEIFLNPDRLIVGLEFEVDKIYLQELLNPITENIIWVTIESAEMIKHAINAFLATSVVFINELATLCEHTGANVREVEKGLKTEERIGPKAYLRAGGAIGGGTLLRDVHYLTDIAKAAQINTPLISGTLVSNETHKHWSCQRILQVLKDLQGKKIAVLGLAYKIGTDTLRRSTAIEICQWLIHRGAIVTAFDPLIKQLPNDLCEDIQLTSTLEEALDNANAIVISNECTEFERLTPEYLLGLVEKPVLFDPNGFLSKNLENDTRICYFSVGR